MVALGKMAVPTLWKSWSKRRRRFVAWTAGLLAFYTAFGFLALPLVVRAVATKRLTRELNREVSIESVRVNPYSLSCAIRGLLIKDPDGETFVSWDKVYVNFQLASFLGRPWVFKEFSTTNTYVRAQMNKDYTFNFSDLLTKFSQANPQPTKPSKPFALRIEHLSIRGARASLADLTPRQPFRRIVGPLEITLDNFHTDPNSKNPHAFTGSTDSGEVFSWSGYFFLNPIRAAGELSIANVALNKYAALYQDFVRFEIQDGIASVRGGYEFTRTPETNVVLITNFNAALRSFKLSEPGSSNRLIEIPALTVSQLNGDLINRRLEVGSLSVTGAMVNLRRAQDASINLVEITRPPVSSTNAPGGILVLLRGVTNVFSKLLASTNAAVASLRDLSIENCSVSMEDEVQSRPVRLNLDEVQLSAKNLSNLPGTNLTANLSLRWNTNGAIKTDVTASLAPLTADIRVRLDQVELQPLNPYLESHVNLFVLGSNLGLDGRIEIRTETGDLPAVTFSGSSSLDNFATLDGVMTEDLIKWRSLRLGGMAANLNPPEVSFEKVELHDAFARLAIETNRSINVLAALKPAHTNLPSSPAPETPQAKAGKRALAQIKELMSQTNALRMTNVPKFAVKMVAISNAHVQLVDRSLLPNVAASLQQVNGTITDISSEEVRRAHIHLQGKVDNTGPVEITGHFNPLHRQSASEVKIVFHDVDLNPADPYTGKFLGYRLRKGKLSMEVDYAVTANHLKGRNAIHLDQLTLGEKVNSPEATKLPIKLGLALLKDRSGKIELDVPVEGRLDDQEFRLSGVIWHAVINVFTKIVTSPFAALGSLFGGKGEEVRYQEFDPGAFELQTAGHEKLDTLLKALYERPGLEVEIEGQVHPVSDRAALRQRKLEQQLRLAKWTRLRKSEQNFTSPDKIVVAPDERAVLLAELYGKAFPQTASGNSRSTADKLLRPIRPESKGAIALVQQAKPEELASAIADLQQQLIEAMTIDDAELLALAAERARKVQLYLIQSGKIEAERVYLMRSDQGTAATNGTRALLHLR